MGGRSRGRRTRTRRARNRVGRKSFLFLAFKCVSKQRIIIFAAVLGVIALELVSYACRGEGATKKLTKGRRLGVRIYRIAATGIYKKGRSGKPRA